MRKVIIALLSMVLIFPFSGKLNIGEVLKYEANLDKRFVFKIRWIQHNAVWGRY